MLLVENRAMILMYVLYVKLLQHCFNSSVFNLFSLNNLVKWKFMTKYEMTIIQG